MVLHFGLANAFLGVLIPGRRRSAYCKPILGSAVLPFCTTSVSLLEFYSSSPLRKHREIAFEFEMIAVVMPQKPFQEQVNVSQFETFQTAQGISLEPFISLPYYFMTVDCIVLTAA